MNAWEKLKSFVNVPQEDYEDDDIETDDYDYDDREEAPVRASRQPSKPKKSLFSDDYDDDEYGAFEPDRREEKPRYRQPAPEIRSTSVHGNKVVDIHTTAKLQVVLTKPVKFLEAREIADNLNEKRTVVLNLESAPKDEAIRILDFLSGVAYANDGEIKKIAKSTFIITSYNVDVTGDLLYELENNGVFFG